MKRFKICLIAILLAVFSVGIFSACDEQKFETKFNQGTITIVCGQEYDPYSFIEDEISDKVKKNIIFKISDSSIATMTPENKIVASGAGMTIISVYYNSQKICWSYIKVEPEPINLTAPVNIHYSQAIGKLTWDYAFVQGERSLFTVTEYTVELSRTYNNQTTTSTQNFKFTNEFAIKNIGEYRVRIKSVGTSPYVSSDYAKDANGNYTYYDFAIMATPTDLEYNNTSSTLSWQANGNPSGTKYSVKYTFNGEEEKVLETTETSIVLPSLNSGDHSVYVDVVPQDENWYGNASEVLNLKKLATPTINFNNGLVSWNAINDATRYQLDYTKNTTTITKSTSELNYNLYNVASGNYNLKVYATSTRPNVFTSEPAETSFTKLVKPIVNLFYNSATNLYTFSVSNYGGEEYQIVVSNSLGTITDTKINSSYTFNKIDNLQYSVSAQLLAKDDYATKIDSEKSSTFKFDSKTLTYIQNLQAPELEYFEDNGVAKLSFEKLTENASYKLYLGNNLQELTLDANTTYTLGNVSSLFDLVKTYSYSLNTAKNADSTTIYISATSYVDIVKLSAPTKITFFDDRTKIRISDSSLDSHITDIKYTINDIATQSLDLTKSSWNITAKFIASTDFDNNTHKTYYTSSDSANFTIARLTAPTNFAYDYDNNKFKYSAVTNAVSYKFIKDGNAIEETSTTNQFAYDQKGNYTMEIVAVPNFVSNMLAGSTTYYFSNPTSTSVYQTSTISNLYLEKVSGNLTAKWSAPENQDFAQNISYDVYINDTYIETTTDTFFGFSANLFENTGNYEIEIKITPNSEFFTPSGSEPSVVVSKLSAPEKLTRSNLTLTVSGFNSNIMSGIILNGTPVANSANNFEMDINEGETAVYVVAYAGIFDADSSSYYLDSAISTFKVIKLCSVYDLDLNIETIGTTTSHNFTWKSQDKSLYTDNITFKFKKIKNEITYIEEKTSNLSQSIIQDGNSEYSFVVKEIAKTSFAEIRKDATAYLDSDNEVIINVTKDNAVENLSMVQEEGEIKVTWDYTKVEGFSANENYLPNFIITYQKIGDTSSKKTTIISQANCFDIVEGYYSFIFNSANFDFVSEGDFRITIAVCSDKTLSSDSSYITITRLKSVKFAYIKSTTAQFVASQANAPLTLTGVQKVSVKVNDEETLILSNNQLDLRLLEPENPYIVEVQLIAQTERLNNQYFLNSDISHFKFIKFSSVSCNVNFDSESISWTPNTYASYYSLKIQAIRDSLTSWFSLKDIAENIMDFSHADMVNVLSYPGIYKFSVMVNRDNKTISNYDASDNETIGYVSSDYGEYCTIEKLSAPTNSKISTSTEDLTQQTATLTWTNVSGVECYKIYVSEIKNELGTLLATVPTSLTTKTSYDISASLTEAKTYYYSVKSFKTGYVSSNASSQVSITRLDAITDMNIDSNLLATWTPTAQISSGTLMQGTENNYYSYYLEVLNTSGVVQTSYGADKTYKNSTYNLSENEFINELNGENFALRITILGNGSSANQTPTLSSASYTLNNVYKLEKPTISILENKINITSEDLVSYPNLLKIMFEIKSGADTLLPLTEYAPNTFEIESSWAQTEFTINAYITTKAFNENSKNIIKSNTQTLVHEKLSEVQNLKASSTYSFYTDVSQKSVKLSWDASENAESYEIFVNGNKVDTVSELQYISDTLFVNAGTYNIQVRAISSAVASSNLCDAITILRLNKITSGNINSEKIVSFNASTQTANVSGYYFELYQNAESGHSIKSYQIKTNLDTTYDGFATGWLSNSFNGGFFNVGIRAYGTGSFNSATKTTILSSDEFTIEGFKLYVPTLTINPSALTLQPDSTSSSLILKEEYSVQDLCQNIITIETNGTFAKTSNGLNIENYALTSSFNYPEAWLAGDYTFTYQSTPKINELNIIPSNILVKTATRLSAPTDLTFTRNTLLNNHNSDTTLAEYYDLGVKFSFSQVENSSSYLLKNGYYSYITETNAIAVADDFETMLNSGSSNSKVLKVQAIANAGTTYINSQISSINYKTQYVVNNFISKNGSMTWNTQNSATCYVVRANDSGTNVNYWQSENGLTNSSVLNGILTSFEEGTILLNIKAIGNISTEGNASGEIILDSPFMEQNSTFNKLSAPTNLHAYLGYVAYNKVVDATAYTAYVYDELTNLVLKTNLENITTGLNYNEDDSTVIVNSNDFYSRLTPNTAYNIKVQATSTAQNIIYSDISDSGINIKILPNANNNARDISLLFASSGNLIETQISAYAIANSYGLLQKSGDTIQAVIKTDDNYLERTKLSLPIVVTDGGKDIVYTFASLGSSTLVDGYYLLSSAFTTSNPIHILEKPEVSIKDGVITWTCADNPEGYYVYINDSLYNNSIFMGTSLDLPSSFGGLIENTDISLKIYAVSADADTLFSPVEKHDYSCTINQTQTDKEVNLIKLIAPKTLQIQDGAMIYLDGFTKLNSFNSLDFGNMLANLQTNPTEENIDAFVEYYENIFTSPILTFSKYTGFTSGKLILTLKNTLTNLTYTVNTDAINFLNLTEQQRDIMEDMFAFSKQVLSQLANNYVITNYNSEKEIYFGSNQTYSNQTEYLSYYIKHLNDIFSSVIMEKILNLSTDENNGFPDIIQLFEELGADTRAIPAGNYELTLKQVGNNFDWLNSSISNEQTINIPNAPSGLTISDLDGDYILSWNKVSVPSTYNAKLNETTNTTTPVYILYGENLNGERFELLRTNGIQTLNENRLYLNLSSLVNESILTPEIKKIFLVVAGDSNSVIHGIKSQEFAISVLSEVVPTMDNGIITWNSDVGAFGYELIATADGAETVIKSNYTLTTWVGDELVSGTTYNLTIRALGKIYNQNGDMSYVISGKTFNCIVSKLAEMDVSVNEYGIFNWDSVQNAFGFIVNVANLANAPYVFADNGEATCYEAIDAGFNIYQFRALGYTGGMIADSTDKYYLSSRINNNQAGLMAHMLNGVNSVFIEDGLIKWTTLGEDHSTNNNLMNKVVGYRLTFNNGLPSMFTTIISNNASTAQQYSIDTAGNRCFDFTTYGTNNFYSVIVQPYIYYEDNDKQNKSNAIIVNPDNSLEYIQLMGAQNSTEFTKIPAPTAIEINNGQIVWTGNDDDCYYVEISTNTGVLKSYQVFENSWWTDDNVIITGQEYTAKIKAYKEDCVFSTYSALAGLIDENLIAFQKLATPSLSVRTYSANDSNLIEFEYPEQSVEVGFNIKYRANNGSLIEYVDITDTNYNDIVSTNIDETIKVTININAINPNIKTMEYYIQIVPMGSTKLLKSNFTTMYTYTPPTALTEVLQNNGDFFFEYKGATLGYIIKDEIMTGDDVIATLYYKIAPSDLTTSNFYSRIGSKGYIHFMPSVMGYKHRVSVAVSMNPYDIQSLMSTYTTCEQTYENNLFAGSTDVFASNPNFFTNDSNEWATNYLTQNAYGTFGNPYKISSNEDLAKINQRLIRYSYTMSYVVEYELTNGTQKSISVNETSSNYYFLLTTDLTNVNFMLGQRLVATDGAINYKGFAGTFDGNNKTISYAITAQFTSEKLGLFMQTENTAIIKNLKVNASINFAEIETSAQIVGGIVAENKGNLNNVSLESISVSGITNSALVGLNSLVFGGISGINSGEIKNATTSPNCSLTLALSISGTSMYAGGIVGKNSGSILQSGNNMTLSVEVARTASVGGVAGINSGIIQECYNKGIITTTYTVDNSTTNLGGIAGENTTTTSLIQNSYTTGNIVCKTTKNVYVNAGGIVGITAYLTINNCYSSIEQVVIAEGTNTLYGGTLIGIIQNAPSSTTYKNYYFNQYALSTKTTPTYVVNASTYSQQTFVETLNSTFIPEQIYVVDNNGTTPKLAWEI